MTNQEFSNVMLEGRPPQMSQPGFISNVGGGKVCGLCSPAGLFAQGTNLATLSPFLYCLFVPLLPPQPVICEQLFEMLPPPPLAT